MIRRHVDKGLRCGAKTFIETIERLAGRDLHHRAQGRPIKGVASPLVCVQPSIKRMIELDPDFEATAREKRWKTLRYQEPLLDQFMDGLRKAGMKIPDNKK